jgi:putative hydrolase
MIYYDLHLHTNFSDGRSPLVDIIRSAISNGLDCIALTDHISPISKVDWIETYRQAAEEYKSEICILVGAEGCILNPEGEISVNAETRAKLDLLLVDFAHNYSDRIFKNCTTKEQLLKDVEMALCNLCDNPLVDIVAHPFNLGRTPMPIALSEISDAMFHRIAEKFAETGTIFEIMNSMSFWFPKLSVKQFNSEYLHIVNIFKEHKVKFSVGSDSHSCCGVGNLKWSEKIISEAKIEDLLINPRKEFQ